MLDLIATKNVEPIRGEYESKTCASPSSAKPPHFTMLVVENAHHVEKNQNILASLPHFVMLAVAITYNNFLLIIFNHTITDKGSTTPESDICEHFDTNEYPNIFV